MLRRPYRGRLLLWRRDIGQRHVSGLWHGRDHEPVDDPRPLNPVASPLQIRPFGSADRPGVWVLLEPVFRAGETFPHDPSITEAKALWEEQSQAVLVTLDDNDTVIGSDYLRPNSLCLGAPVANAGYVVAEAAGGPAAGLPGDAVQPGGQDKHHWSALLAAERLSADRSSIRLIAD